MMDRNGQAYGNFGDGAEERLRPNGAGGKEYASEGEMSVQDQVREFLKGAAEMSVQFAVGCKDVVVQSIGREDSFIVRNFGRSSCIGKVAGCASDRIRRNLKMFNEYLPEDKDPLHAFSVICLVFFLALVVLNMTTEREISAPLMKKVSVHPPSADRIMLPDGRFMAYKEQGVPIGRARFSMIAPHTFLSSRLAGIPGVKASLLEEFGIHLITYDLPGFGESDPHPSRTLESSALDMQFLANALGIKDKFWVLGYSSGSLHAWAALKYIPDKLAGAAIFAPMVNPYDSLMTKEERRGIWEKWTRKRKFMYFLARRFPSFLGHFYRQSFLSGKHEKIDIWLSLSLVNRVRRIEAADIYVLDVDEKFSDLICKWLMDEKEYVEVERSRGFSHIKDKALIEDPIYEEFWQRDVEESIRQGNTKPFTEESVLQVSKWGFSLADIKLQKKKQGKSILNWLQFFLNGAQEEYTGFLGPIHIWQGMDDRVVPPLMTDFVHRILPGSAVHKLPYEGHFTYLYFCDECHRQIFTTLFGTPRGPVVDGTIEPVSTPKDDTIEPVPTPKDDFAEEQQDDRNTSEVDVKL